MLQYFDPDMHTFIFVDASKHGFGAILCQGSDIDSIHPVTVASRATSPAESRYPQIDLEAMAIDFALRRFRFYLVGGPQSTIITDHKPLVPIFNDSRRGSIRSERIKLRNQDIDYVVTYQKGKLNMSDYFSRHAVPLNLLNKEILTETDEHSKLLYNLSTCPYTKAIPKDLIVKHTDEDNTLTQLKYAIYLGYCPAEAESLKPYRKIFNELSIDDDGIILRDSRVVLPEVLQELSIQNAHEGGHPGMDRLKSRIRAYYWFPNLDNLVEECVKSCECQLYTRDRLKNPITSAPTPELPWKNVSVDLFGPMPKDDHVLVIRDNLSKFPAAEIVNSTSSKHVIPAMDQIYTNFGTPDVHKTDSGPPFNGETFKKYSEDNNIKHKRIPPHHPQGNEAETFMKPLAKAMKLAHHNKLDKKQELRKFIKEYRMTPHTSTGFAPGDVMLRAGFNTGEQRKPPPNDIIKQVQQADATSKAKNNEYVNSKRFRKRRTLVQGDMILAKNFTRTKKFDPFYEKEPYIIMEKEGESLFLQRTSDGRKIKRHISCVKPFFNNPQNKDNLINDITSDENYIDFEEFYSNNDTTQELDNNDTPIEDLTPHADESNTIPLGDEGSVAIPEDVPDSNITLTHINRRSTRPRTKTKNTIYRDFV